MQKFVVKKSKSAPIAPSSSQPLQPKAVVSSAENTVPTPENATTAKLNSPESTAVCKSDATTKQTAIKSATSSPSSTVSASHVKMSGYLKKKRNVSKTTSR